MVRVNVKNRCVFFSMDAANKGDLYHMVKIMTCWDFYEDELMVHNIDSVSCLGTHIDANHAADFSMRKIDSNGTVIQL